MSWLNILLSTGLALCFGMIIWALLRKQMHVNHANQAAESDILQNHLRQLAEQIQQAFVEQQLQMGKQQVEQIQQLQNSIKDGLHSAQEHISHSLRQHANLSNDQMHKLIETTQQRLGELSKEVNVKLNEGFEKTNATFTDVRERLAIIDKAQQQIANLSHQVVDLQSLLSDKRSRGALGEVQLHALISNMIPKTHYALQHTLSNNKRCDCMLFLPPPTGNVVIDAKFPLETFQRLQDLQVSPADKRELSQQFRADIRKHIQDIADKYIVPGETAEGAMLFLPAEAIFAEIHSEHPELIEFAHKKRVWLVSPTTLMAVLTTARAVLKDAATREQIHIIQEHLSHLAGDFNRFQKRMDALARHISQAHDDMGQVHTSARKITRRFEKIEKVELLEEQSDAKTVLLTEES